MVAVCDVNSKRLAEVRELAGGERVWAYHDYRQLLANNDVDAVLIATNVHWHVLCTIHACQAGKDVYVEKPLCHFSGEGPFAIAAAKKYDRIVQIGTNQHSCAHYRKAVEIIQSGRLGNIMEVKVWDTEHYGSLGPRPPDRDPPPELDWDFYVGPSPLRPYNPCYHAFDWFKLGHRRIRSGTGGQGRQTRHHCRRALVRRSGVHSPARASHPARARSAPYLNNELLQNTGDHPFDVDGDGWVDVISVGWTDKEICWYQNPAGRYDEHPWKRHVLGAIAGENEAIALHDFDGDGRPEIYVSAWNKRKPQVIHRFTQDVHGHQSVSTTENYYINTKPALRAAAGARKVHVEQELTGAQSTEDNQGNPSAEQPSSQPEKPPTPSESKDSPSGSAEQPSPEPDEHGPEEKMQNSM